MQKFIISVKEKNTGRDVFPPYIVDSLEGLGHYSERVSSFGLIVIVYMFLPFHCFFHLLDLLG